MHAMTTPSAVQAVVVVGKCRPMQHSRSLYTRDKPILQTSSFLWGDPWTTVAACSVRNPRLWQCSDAFGTCLLAPLMRRDAIISVPRDACMKVEVGKSQVT